MPLSPAASSSKPADNGSGNSQPFSSVLARNIETLVGLRRQAEEQKTRQERAADAITRFTGSLKFVYIHLAVFSLWIGVNLPWAPGALRFDPSFVILAMTASVEAIFLSTFILISQNRQAAESDKRAELDLQISLLAEPEITQAVKLLDAIARRLGVHGPRDAQADPGAVEDSKHEVTRARSLKPSSITGKRPSGTRVEELRPAGSGALARGGCKAVAQAHLLTVELTGSVGGQAGCELCSRKPTARRLRRIPQILPIMPPSTRTMLPVM